MDQILYFDAIGILKAFAVARAQVSEELFLKLTEDIVSQASKLAVPHIVQCLEICERFQTRPQVLYVELFHHLIRLAPAMYPDELVQTFQVLVRLELSNPYLLKEMHKFVLLHQKELRFLHLCSLQCCLTVLDAAPQLEDEVAKSNKSYDFKIIIHLFLCAY